MRKFTFLLVLLMSTCLQSQTVFDWESNTNEIDANTVTQTKDEITVTASMPDLRVQLSDVTAVYYPATYPGIGWEVMEGTVLLARDGIGLSGGVQKDFIFTFSEPVTVNKLYAGNGNESPIASHRVTFTTNDGIGNNDVVFVYDVVTVHEIILNWTDVTSFTVKSENISGAGNRTRISFENMIINDPSLSTEAASALNNNFILYPNPVENILHAKTSTKVNSIKVFNSLGKILLETTNKDIDFSSFSNGIYFVQINSDFGSKTKRVVKL